MAKTTIYSFVKYMMYDDEEFQYGGVGEKEDKYLNAIDMTEEDTSAFFTAMYRIRRLHYKYKKGE